MRGRELEEETGRRAGTLRPLTRIHTTPGFTDEVIHLYAGFDLEHVGQQLEEDEVIELVPMALTEALELVHRGELRDSKTALCLLLAAQRMAGRAG